MHPMQVKTAFVELFDGVMEGLSQRRIGCVEQRAKGGERDPEVVALAANRQGEPRGQVEERIFGRQVAPAVARSWCYPGARGPADDARVATWRALATSLQPADECDYRTCRGTPGRATQQVGHDVTVGV